MKFFNAKLPTENQLLRLAVLDQDLDGAIKHIRRGADVQMNNNELFILSVLNFDLRMAGALILAGADSSANNNEALTIARGQEDAGMVELIECAQKALKEVQDFIVYNVKK